MVLSEIYWTFLTGSCFAFLGLTIRALLKSKCDNVECCGLKIHRNVELEEKIDELELQQERHQDNNLMRI